MSLKNKMEENMEALEIQVIFAENDREKHIQLKNFFNSFVKEFPKNLYGKLNVEAKYVRSIEDLLNQTEKKLVSTLCVFLNMNILRPNANKSSEELDGEFLFDVLSQQIPVIAYLSIIPNEVDTLWDENKSSIYWIDNNILFEDTKEKLLSKKINNRNIINYVFSNHPIFKYEYEGIKTQKIDLLFKQEKESHIQVNTEYSPLKKVIIHSPGDEINLPPPECDNYLFDHPVNAELFKHQHTKFKNSLKSYVERNNGEVLEATDILKSVLENDDILFYFINDLVQLHNLEKKYIRKLFSLYKNNPKRFIKMLIDGNLDEDRKERFIAPLPNFMFTRDWAFSIGEHIFVSKMNKSVRKREGLISSYILKYNFPNNYVDNDMLKLEKEDTIEGGDVMLLPQNVVLIGISDRTNLGAIKKLAKFLGKESKKESSQNFTVYAIKAPFNHKRSMHLDTYMGVFSQDSCVAYYDPLQMEDEFYRIGKDGKVEQVFYETLETMISKEFKLNMKIIWTYDEKDQFNDGCNIFTLEPFKYFSYEITKVTIDAVKNGFEEGVVEIVPIDGSELALARGGCHCMTLPLLREK